jgi:hypothetical protein
VPSCEFSINQPIQNLERIPPQNLYPTCYCNPVNSFLFPSSLGTHRKSIPFVWRRSLPKTKRRQKSCWNSTSRQKSRGYCEYFKLPRFHQGPSAKPRASLCDLFQQVSLPRPLSRRLLPQRHAGRKHPTPPQRQRRAKRRRRYQVQYTLD